MPKQPNGTPCKKPTQGLIEPFVDRSALPRLGHTSGIGASFRHLSVDSGWQVPPQRHRLSPNRRRALELLANTPDGATNELLVAVQGIGRDTIAGLVRTGLATVRYEVVRTGSETIRVKRYRITNAGRIALEGWPARLIHPPL